MERVCLRVLTKDMFFYFVIGGEKPSFMDVCKHSEKYIAFANETHLFHHNK